MNYECCSDLIQAIEAENLPKTDATRKLTEFYAKARFGIDDKKFDAHFCDGSDDGGIDFFYKAGNTFYIFQTKYSADTNNEGEWVILHDINKIKNSLEGHNPNIKADEFVQNIKNDSGNKLAVLEIIWLTTKVIKDPARKLVQDDLLSWKKKMNWSLDIDFISIDKYNLDSVIYDVAHGYVPYTGKQTLKLEPKNWIENKWEDTGVYSVICNVKVNHILKWFKNAGIIDQFLQKNVRQFLGETVKINKEIGKSFRNDPIWFWYKHNGIIIFADNLKIDKAKMILEMRNPQIVNGGQTIQSLYPHFLKIKHEDNDAKILLRAFRMPYEDDKTHRRSIDIIAALNTQSKINPSDLKSTDPRQVRLEMLFKEFDFKYYRKRSKAHKALAYSITMRKLAMAYHVCKKKAPHEGVRGSVEALFEENSKYDDVFPKGSIFQELHNNHILLKYITCWIIDQKIKQVSKNKNLPKKYAEFFRYTRWYVLNDVYHKVLDWKNSKYNMGWKSWVDFIKSPRIEKAIRIYSRSALRLGREILPNNEEPAAFYKTKNAAQKYNKKVKKQDFMNRMNKAYKIFQNEN